jgi:hypothetical protein
MIKPHIPERFQEGIANYYVFGIKPGSFLAAVLANDLQEAFARADTTSVHELPGIVSWLYNYAPASSRGSWAALATWMHHRKEGYANDPDKAKAATDVYLSAFTLIHSDPSELFNRIAALPAKETEK